MSKPANRRWVANQTCSFCQDPVRTLQEQDEVLFEVAMCENVGVPLLPGQGEGLFP